MTTRNAQDALATYTYFYGPDHTEGILSDSLYQLLEGGAVRTHRTPSGNLVAFPVRGGRSVSVLCSEIVMISTEDGPATGRCGAPVIDGNFLCCPGHTAEREGWASLSEIERAQVEVREDRDR
jgi:hypothetical protein